MARRRDAEIADRLAARQRYRNKHVVSLDTCLHNLDVLENFAKIQFVTLLNGKVREFPVVSVTALGGPLDTTGATTTRWLNAGLLPKPVLKTPKGQCYHLEEVRSFIRVIGEHQAEYKYYRANHVATKERLFSENMKVRRNLNL